MRRRPDLGEIVHRAAASPCVMQPSYAVVDHDYRAVDDHSEIHRAQAHQVGAHAEQPHSQKGRQQRQRNHRRHQQRGAELAQRQQQHQHDQRAALDQVVANRADRSVDHLGLVIERNQLHALRQRQLQPLDGRLHALDHRLRVLALEHDDHAGERFALAAARDGALPRNRPDADLRHVVHVHRRTALGGQHDVADLGLAGRPAQTPDRVLLGAMFHEPGPEVGVVLPQTLKDVPQPQPIAAQLLRVDHDLELPREAAPGVDVGDAGDGAQLVLDLPVMQGLELHGVKAAAFDGVLVDLAERRRQRAQLRFQPARDAVARLAQPLVHQLPRQQRVHGVLEDHGDHGQAVLRDRAHLERVRQAHQRRFQRKGDELLGLNGRHARRGGDHRHLVVGQIREGVDRDLRRRVQPEADERGQAQQGRPRMVEAEVDESFDHQPYSPPSSWRNSSVLSRNAPWTTTRSPASTPESNTVRSPIAGPTLTGRTS